MSELLKSFRHRASALMGERYSIASLSRAVMSSLVSDAEVVEGEEGFDEYKVDAEESTQCRGGESGQKKSN